MYENEPNTARHPKISDVNVGKCPEAIPSYVMHGPTMICATINMIIAIHVVECFIIRAISTPHRVAGIAVHSQLAKDPYTSMRFDADNNVIAVAMIDPRTVTDS